ncbi:MAG: superoxide dismutase [Rickettsiales endosymbiont of Dermacentor nuttalli]
MNIFKYTNKHANQTIYPFVLPNLPYNNNALEPYITFNTLNFHHGKHHNTYVTNLNNLIKDTELSNKSLEDIILSTYQDISKTSIFNNAAQIWNHSFYWHSMKANSRDTPSQTLLNKINEDFGSFDKFKEEFKNAGAKQFGSGWAWLVLEGNQLKVTKTGNADLPITHNQVALLTCDVWEHAYYLDYQNRRPDYITTFLDKLANWEFAEENFLNAQK